jgi:hypothetical protein
MLVDDSVDLEKFSLNQRLAGMGVGVFCRW